MLAVFVLDIDWGHNNNNILTQHSRRGHWGGREELFSLNAQAVLFLSLKQHTSSFLMIILCTRGIHTRFDNKTNDIPTIFLYRSLLRNNSLPLITAKLHYSHPTVALTKTAKKTREHKTTYVDTVRNAIDASDRVYLFSYENMRSNHFKDVRLHFRGSGSSKHGDGDMIDDVDDDVDEGSTSLNDGRLFLGKNKLLQIALGRTPEDEYSDNLHQLSKLISGSVGLLCTNQNATHVEEYFKTLAVEDYARAGTVAERTILLTKEQIETHPVSMVEQFRKLGLPVEVQNGRVGFVGGRMEWEVCKAGKELSVEQCKILVHMGVKLAVFRIGLVCRWEKQDGAIEEL